MRDDTGGFVFVFIGARFERRFNRDVQDNILFKILLIMVISGTQRPK